MSSVLIYIFQLSSHTGWADLSNYVLRCHLCLDIPNEDNSCGLLVSGDVSFCLFTLFSLFTLAVSRFSITNKIKLLSLMTVRITELSIIQSSLLERY